MCAHTGVVTAAAIFEVIRQRQKFCVRVARFRFVIVYGLLQRRDKLQAEHTVDPHKAGVGVIPTQLL